MQALRRLAPALAALALFASCGGGDAPPRPTPASGAAAFRDAVQLAISGSPRRTRLAVAPAAAGAVDPIEAAEQLLDFAEASFPALFPGPQASADLAGYRYRYYPATGIYLGVRDGQVYGLGGAFGSEVVGFGPLTQFLTPQALPAPCADAGASADTHLTRRASVGRSATLLVMGCRGTVASAQWRQLAGPAVALVTARGQALSFVPDTAGTYRFAVDYVDAASASRSATLALQVAEASPSRTRLALRTNPTVRMGGPVSVRAWPQAADGDAISSIAWTQLDGPAVTLDTTDDHIAHFTAPEVTTDTLIRLRATVTTAAGDTALDEVAVLVERHAQAPASDPDALWSGEHLERVVPHNPASRHAANLERCSYSASQYASGARYNLCTLGTLSFLGQETFGALPTVQQVMDRVLVSHDWMGRNFEAFLREHDREGDFRRMLQSVTTIVIGSRIRPSYYYAGTGAIYLDADSFWMTPEERDTLNERPDYRSAFDDGLQFDNLWRYVRGGQNLFLFDDPRQRVTRGIDRVRDEAASLMYHELGHALDYLPPTSYAGVSNRLSAWSNLYNRLVRYELASDAMFTQYPLASSEMTSLAQVTYRGEPATDAQRAYTPEQVASFFAFDLATDDYAYTTQFEDLAMTLEELLMASRLGVQRDVAYSGKISDDDTSATIIVRWGQRGRVGEAAIRPKAREIARQLVPWFDLTEVDRLPAPAALRAGESWRANLGPPSVLRQPLRAEPRWLEAWRMRHELRRIADQRRAALRPLPLPPPDVAAPPWARQLNRPRPAGLHPR